MATYSTLGITLIARKYKGTGRVVTFYTPDRGIVEAVAQGVGKPGSKFAAAVESFTLSRLMLAEGRNLDRLAQAEVLESHYPLRNDMTRLAYAAYIAELIARTSEPDHPLPGIFEKFGKTLSALCDARDPELVLWWFLRHFFAAHGVTSDLMHCSRCGDGLAGHARYIPGDGTHICEKCVELAEGMTLSPEARGLLMGLPNLPVERLERLSFSDRARGEIRRIMDAHADHQFGIETKSRKFLQQMRSHEQ